MLYMALTLFVLFNVANYIHTGWQFKQLENELSEDIAHRGQRGPKPPR